MGGREYASVPLLNKALNVIYPLGDGNRGNIEDVKSAQEICREWFHTGEGRIAVF